MDEIWYATEPCGCATGAADGDMTENAARRLLNGSLLEAMTDHRTYMRGPRSEIHERMPRRCPHLNNFQQRLNHLEETHP